MGAAVVASSYAAGPMRTAHADTTSAATEEWTFARLINQARVAQGLAPLGVFAPMVGQAEAWSTTMASNQVLAHDPNIRAEISSVAQPFNGGGENVGEGSGSDNTPEAIHAAFMASPVHHANIMGNWQYVAVGVAFDGSGGAWVTERFLNAPPKPASSQVPVTRLAGASDADTGAAVSRFLYPGSGSARSVVLGRNDVFADALAGGPLASADGGPLLLTDPGSLAAPVLAEIRRVLPAGGPVHLLGGPGALAPAVEQSLRAAGYTTDRLAGSDRFATAVAIARSLGWSGGPAFLASGFSFPDALVAGPAAAQLRAPILLTDPGTLSQATASAIAATPSSPITVVGGTAVVSDAVAAAAGAKQRVGGADRYETSTLMAGQYFPSATQVTFAGGSSWQDALVGAPASARLGAPTLLVAPAPAGSTVGYVDAHAAAETHAWVYGTPDAVPDAALTELFGAA